MYKLFNYILFDPGYNANVLYEYSKLMKSQWYDHDTISERQDLMFNNLFDYVCSNVSFYKKTLSPYVRDYYLSGGNIRDKIAQLPVLHKQDIRSEKDKLVSNDYNLKTAKVTRTGGSTGEPLEIILSYDRVVGSLAAILRGKNWSNIFIGDKCASLKAHGKISYPGRLHAKLINNYPFDSCSSSKHLREYVIPRLIKYKPKCLIGYPSSLLALADLALNKKITIPVLLTTGEMLYEEQKKYLSNTFNAHVCDYYGSNEVSGVAFECEHGIKHITDEHVIVEVVDKNDKQVWDDVGRILITDLRNRKMPFIRYEIGDLGVLTRKKCACGRQLTVLKDLFGRTQDLIKGENGVVLSGVYFAGIFRGLKKIKSYQILQKETNLIIIRYVPYFDDYYDEVSYMVKIIKDKLGRSVVINTEKYNDLKLTRAGKSRLVIGMDSEDPFLMDK